MSEDTELILFCNDDVELLNDALSRCVDVYVNNKNTVGTIGIRLHYDDSSIQHNGIEIYRDTKGHIHLTHTDMKKTSKYNTTLKSDSIGNTGAFLLINKKLFINCGYFNESYIECFEDVELNLKCLLKHKKNITACDAVAYHYESQSRTKSKESLERLQEDYIKRLHPFYVENKEKLLKYFKLLNQ